LRRRHDRHPIAIEPASPLETVTASGH
jgi:hypothetical protein